MRMLKRYKFQTWEKERTQTIAREFGRVCEDIRPRGEVWGLSLQGGMSMGKSTFTHAFTKAVFAKNWDAPFWNIRPHRSHDIISNWSKKQLRHNDYLLNNGNHFFTPRKAGFGGYDILEHAPKDFQHIAGGVFMPGYRTRLLVLQVDEKIWSAPVFQQAVQKLNATELNA